MKFNPADMAVIEPGNPAWQTVKTWAEWNLERLRDQRENELADLRKLDVTLGSIIAMKMLLELPELIRVERKRGPVQGDEFNIPTPDGY